MPRNGTGTYSLPPAVNPIATGAPIESAPLNTTYADIATALTASLTADGQKVWTGDQSAGSKKITALASGTASGDAVNKGQLDLKADATALAAKANIASPAFTGTPTAPAPANGTNNTQIATTAFAEPRYRTVTTVASGGSLVAGTGAVYNLSGGTVSIPAAASNTGLSIRIAAGATTTLSSGGGSIYIRTANGLSVVLPFGSTITLISNGSSWVAYEDSTTVGGTRLHYDFLALGGSLSANYTTTLSEMHYVTVQVAAFGFMEAVVGGAGIGFIYNQTASPTQLFMSFIVPANTVYRMNASAGSSIAVWRVQRL